MREFIADAVVLDRRPLGENDLLVDLFTGDLGRVKAKVVSGRKILSKLSGCLDTLNLVEARIVEKKNFTIADAVARNTFSRLRKSQPLLGAALCGARAIKALLPPGAPDPALWHEFTRMLKNSAVNTGTLLKILGYSPRGSVCVHCGRNKAAHFNLRDQIFLCALCGVMFPENNLLLQYPQ